MAEQKQSLFQAKVYSMCIDQNIIYTSSRKNIYKWDKNTKELIDAITVPKNDNLKKGVTLCVDENNIYFTSIYFFHAMDKKTNEIIYQKQFGTDNSSDFDLGTILVDDNQVYFPMRHRGVVVVDKSDYENVKYVHENDGSMWGIAQDEKILYVGGVNKTIYGIDKSTLQTTVSFSGHRGNIHSIYPYKDYIITTGSDGTIIIWNKENGSIVNRIKKAESSLGGVVMNDTHIVSVAKGKIKIWEIETLNLVAKASTFGDLNYYDDVLYFTNRDVDRVSTCKIDDIIKEIESAGL